MHHTALHRMAALLINKTIRLSPAQITALREEGARDRRDLSALVRIAVDDLIAARRQLALKNGGSRHHKDNGR
jgi:hypothetical protein